jgi:hypothetical protein
MPLRTKKGGVRFITRDAFVLDLFKMYPNMYTPVPFSEQSVEYVFAMAAQIDDRQDIRIEEYTDNVQRYKSMYTQLIEQYIPPIQK